MSWTAKVKPSLEGTEKVSVGAGVFRRCSGCDETILAEEFERNLEVCPRCGKHFRLHVKRWANLLLDPGSLEPFATELAPKDPLSFTDGRPYTERIRATQKKSSFNEAMVSGRATLDGRQIVIAFFVFDFMGGSMGSVVGEKLARTFEIAAAERRPAIVLSSSGGARMQEGILSLMQMAKSVAALGRLRDVGVPFLSLLTDPTTGGVAASYALLGDVNIAEPQALIGFAGARVIEQTIRQKLPEGFQRSEFLLAHGMVDIIVERHAMRATLARLLGHLVG
ncbi:MAG: acetyl-CoA carboxylase, carboxyltransferase subunit beta [Deltaproteobacteria bacterium]|nr:acetyl-CoA carboxylase, carboxyltransferase subunit beta [Deltaproteobacteria bacterium]